MLNAKQIRFCEEYVIDFNATAAAIRAGYSKKTARVIGSENLTKPDIKKKVEELREDLRNKSALTADMVITELRHLGFWNIQDFIEKENVITDLTSLSRQKTIPISGIKIKESFTKVGDVITKEVTTELKITDKRAALVDLGRHLGVFEKDNEQKKPVLSNSLTDEQFNKLLNAAREAKASPSK